MTFGDLAVGDKFFDPYCGESFVKTTDECGYMFSEDAVAVFKPEEEVVPE